MVRTYKTAHILVIFLLLTAGCAGEENLWKLDMGGHDEKVESGYRFIGVVGLGGHYEEVSVYGVEVKILDAQNRTLKTVSVGTLNVSRATVEINITVERGPKYVLVLVDQIVAPENGDKEPISGLKRVEGGDYYEYQKYDPTPSSK